MLKQTLCGAAAFAALNMAASAQDSPMSRADPFPTHQFAQVVKDVSPPTAIDWRMFEWPLIASADQVGSGWRHGMSPARRVMISLSLSGTSKNLLAISLRI
jgi:hypothetical protein